MNTGLYQELSQERLLVSHQEENISSMPGELSNVYKILRPELISFISYPYEWSFFQLKKAALLTLDIQLKALQKEMSLKDATAFNVQFKGTEPIFIDTSSFESYEAKAPWQAYGQFCRHFLGPLLLWIYGKKELIKLALSHIDGIPLSIISYCLPVKTRFNFFIFSHIHYHSTLELKHKSNELIKDKNLTISKERLINILIHLKNGIESLELKDQKSEWTGYYDTFSYDSENYNQKQQTVSLFIKSINPTSLLDLGCNEGEFSIQNHNQVKNIVAVDSDPLVITKLYTKLSEQKIKNILPLVIDFNNSSPGIGVNNQERTAFLSRCKFDTVLALALIHHLSIGNNMPFSVIAETLSTITRHLIIEFVPKKDVQAQRLLITKKDVFSNYSLEEFQKSFELFFKINSIQKLDNSDRTLFWMEKHA